MNFEKLSGFSEKVFGNRKILLFLIIANLAGFFAGIYFYWGQLVDSPPLLWILILDSPVSVFLFAVVCLLFYFRKKIPEALKFLASAYVIKYGVWTLLTIWLYWSNYRIFDDQVIGVLDFILHFGMVVEGMVLIPKIRPKIRDALFVLFVCLANDVSDYFFGTVTRIPPAYISLLMTESFAASVLITLSIAVYRISAGSKGRSRP
jgi:uncharacterized membrane protein YpjA